MDIAKTPSSRSTSSHRIPAQYAPDTAPTGSPPQAALAQEAIHPTNQRLPLLRCPATDPTAHPFLSKLLASPESVSRPDPHARPSETRHPRDHAEYGLPTVLKSEDHDSGTMRSRTQ